MFILCVCCFGSKSKTMKHVPRVGVHPQVKPHQVEAMKKRWDPKNGEPAWASPMVKLPQHPVELYRRQVGFLSASNYLQLFEGSFWWFEIAWENEHFLLEVDHLVLNWSSLQWYSLMIDYAHHECRYFFVNKKLLSLWSYSLVGFVVMISSPMNYFLSSPLHWWII